MFGEVIKIKGNNFSFVKPIVDKEGILEHYKESRFERDREKYQRFEIFVNSLYRNHRSFNSDDNVYVHDKDCKPKPIIHGDIVFFEMIKTKKQRPKGKIHFVVCRWRQGALDFFPYKKTNITEKKSHKENNNLTTFNDQFQPKKSGEYELFKEKFIEENENYISHKEKSKQGGEPIVSGKIDRIGKKEKWINIDDIPKSVDIQEKEIEEYQRKRMQKLGAEVDCWVKDDEEGKLFFKVIWGKNNREFIVKHRDRKYNLKRCENVQDYYFIEIDCSVLIEQEEFIIYNKSNEIEIPISRITKNFKSNRLSLEIDSSNSNIIIHSKDITKDDYYPRDNESRIKIELDLLYWDGSKKKEIFQLQNVFANNNSIPDDIETIYKWIQTDESFDDLTAVELRRLLSAKSEPVNGNRSDLITRWKVKNAPVLIKDNSIDVDINKIIKEKMSPISSKNIAAWKVREILIISKEKSIKYSIKRMDAMYWQALSSTYKHKVILNPCTYDEWQNDNANYKISIPSLIAADTHPKEDVGDLIIVGKNINLNEIDKTEENIVRGVFRHISVTDCRAENLEAIGKLCFKMKIDVTANIDEIIKDCLSNTTRAEIIQMNPELNLMQEEDGTSIYFTKNIIVNENLQNDLKKKKLEQWFIHFIIRIDRKDSKSLIKFNLEKCFQHSLPYQMFLSKNRPIIITNQFEETIVLVRGSAGVTGISKYIDESRASATGISKDHFPLDLHHCINCTIIHQFDLSGSLLLKTRNGKIISRVSEKDEQGLCDLKEFKGWEIARQTRLDDFENERRNDNFELPSDFIKMNEIMSEIILRLAEDERYEVKKKSGNKIHTVSARPLKDSKKTKSKKESNVNVGKTKAKPRKFGTVRGGRGEKRR